MPKFESISEDGNNFSSEDLNGLIAIIQQRAKDGKPKPTEIKQGGVTVKLKGFEPKPGTKIQEHENFIEGNHIGWKIRVWKIQKESVYGCNYWKGDDVRYLEVPFGDVRDENGVFKYVSNIIDDI